MTIGVNDAIAGTGLMAGIVSLVLNWRQRLLQRRDAGCLRAEMERSHKDCLGRIGRVGENLETSERNAQSSLELLRDGRLGMPARARALRMLGSGIGAETAAAELGMAKNEVRLLEKVAAVLAPRS